MTSPPRTAMSSSWTILTTCWAGFSASDELDADGPLADPVEHPAHDLEVDVGLEQGDPDLPQDLVDVGLAEAALAPQAGEDRVEPVGEGVEHGPPMLPAPPARSEPTGAAVRHRAFLRRRRTETGGSCRKNAVPRRPAFCGAARPLRADPAARTRGDAGGGQPLAVGVQTMSSAGPSVRNSATGRRRRRPRRCRGRPRRA